MSRILLGNVLIDRDRFEVKVEGRPVALTFVEFELLYTLAKNAGKVMSRARLMRAVWNEDEPEGARKLTVHMSRLRKKLQGSEPWQIETFTKRGYAFIEGRGETAPESTGVLSLYGAAGEG